MDLESGRNELIAYIKKYRFMIMAIVLGVLLMLLPDFTHPKQDQPPAASVSPPELETELSKILSKIQGVGKAEVLLTEISGIETVYQTDIAQSNVDTVIVKDSNREEVGLVKQILQPSYRGAVVICQGADSAAVRLNIVDAVKSATGLPSDCITVLKMK